MTNYSNYWYGTTSTDSYFQPPKAKPVVYRNRAPVAGEVWMFNGCSYKVAEVNGESAKIARADGAFVGIPAAYPVSDMRALPQWSPPPLSPLMEGECL